MLKEKLTSIKFNPAAFDKQKSGLVLTALLSVVGLGAMAVLEAVGLVEDVDISVDVSPE